MLLNFLKRPMPIVLLFIVSVAILLWVKTFVSVSESAVAFEQYPMPLYKLFLAPLHGSPFWRELIALAIIFSCSLYLIGFITNHQLVPNRNYLSALFFIVIGSGFQELQKFNPAFFSVFFLMLSIDHLFKSSATRKPFDDFFRAGFWIGIASLFYLPSVFFYLLIVVSVFLHGSVRFRITLSSLFGILAPWALYMVYEHLWGNGIAESIAHLENVWRITSPIPFSLGPYSIAWLALNIIVFLVAGLYLLKGLLIQKINVRRAYGLLIWFSLITAGAYLLVPSVSIEMAYIAAFPIAIVYSNFFMMAKNRFWPKFLLIAILISVFLSVYL